jgi:mono/diheme cytochrome c family protein
MRKLIVFLIISLAFLLVACGGSGSSSGSENDPPSGSDDQPAASKGDPTAGEPLFQGTCAACHGPDAKGLPTLGKDLTTSEFAKEKTDQELLAFIKVGRPVSDPLNTTNVDMPPKGGNPALSDQDLLNIIAYVRTLEE